MFSYLLVYFLHYVMVKKKKKNVVICVLRMAGSFEILLNV